MVEVRGGSGRSPVGRLYRWCSERGSGRWDDFKHAHAWVHRDVGQVPTASSTARELEVLGYVNFDWTLKTWGTPEPTLGTLPAAGALAVVTGAKGSQLDERLREAALVSEYEVLVERREVGRGLEVVYVQAGDLPELQRFAVDLSLAFRFRLAVHLSGVLPRLQERIAASEELPAPKDSGVSVYYAREGRWQRTSKQSRRGLYRHEPRIGPTQFRFCDDDETCRRVERSVGLYAELRRLNVRPLRYQGADVNGSLLVRQDAALPTVQARCAVLCSGLFAGTVSLGQMGIHHRYLNVPAAVAERIAASLDQELQYVHPDLPLN